MQWGVRMMADICPIDTFSFASQVPTKRNPSDGFLIGKQSIRQPISDKIIQEYDLCYLPIE
ncbi:MAG: hypothetical protein EBT93_10860 [Alphaproteobacteria bacterium]|nr:hypothetical protein [Alphaproteobacteria bacterium]